MSAAGSCSPSTTPDPSERVPVARRHSAGSDPPRPSRDAVSWAVLGAVSAGGVLGALARYGIGLAGPHSPTGIPWATFAINVSGCLLIGILMVVVVEVWPGRRLLRP